MHSKFWKGRKTETLSQKAFLWNDSCVYALDKILIHFFVWVSELSKH